MLPRHLEPHLRKLRRHFPCVAILGVRQCGKTTLLATLPDAWQRFDMERTADRQQLLDDPSQLATHPQLGRSWEGMIIETLLRNLDNVGISFFAREKWRKKAGFRRDARQRSIEGSWYGHPPHAMRRRSSLRSRNPAHHKYVDL